MNSYLSNSINTADSGALRTIKPLGRALLAAALSTIMLSACSSAPERFSGADNARSRLNSLQANNRMVSLAPLAIRDANEAVTAAEQSGKDPVVARHLVMLAERKVDIAEAESQRRLLESERETLSAERQQMQLDARSSEARSARMDASRARSDAEEARRQTSSAEQQTLLAQQQRQEAQNRMSQAEADATEAQKARAEAQIDSARARQSADSAQLDAARARQETADMQQQLNDLNARETQRGMVVTLGDLLFDFNKSDINSSALGHLGKLASFLTSYDRHASIEGHTDSTGPEEINQALSLRRADAVKDYLISQGVDSRSLEASGKGEAFPVAANDTASQRQQNRRVEVIIANTTR